MKGLIAVAFVVFTVGIVATGCHSKNETKTPANATFDAGPPPAAQPEHHFPRE